MSATLDTRCIGKGASKPMEPVMTVVGRVVPAAAHHCLTQLAVRHDVDQ